ncbi:MAG: outer membrane beta-barrel protein [Planctomycetota bacterium]
MRLALCIVSSTLAACATVPSPTAVDSPAADRGDRVAIYLGARALDDDDYEPVEKQAMIGFEYSHEKPDDAVGFEFGLMGSGDEDDIGGFDVKASTGELYVGMRKTFGQENVHPYVGGGLSIIAAEVDVSGSEDDDASPAVYAHAGVRFDASESFFLAVDARVLVGSDLELGGVETDADYGQLAFVFGFAL